MRPDGIGWYPAGNGRTLRPLSLSGGISIAKIISQEVIRHGAQRAERPFQIGRTLSQHDLVPAAENLEFLGLHPESLGKAYCLAVA